MKITLSLPLACAAMAALLQSNVSAQTLYKLIDKDGKVTYSEKPPANFDGKVIRMDIDPNANTATLPKASPPAVETATSRDAPRATPAADSKEARLKGARERLEQAKTALAEALANPKEGDTFPLGVAKRGGAGGGTTGAVGGQGPGIGGSGPGRMPGKPKEVAPGVDPLLIRVGMSDEYRARIEALQKAVTDAQEEIERIERE